MHSRLWVELDDSGRVLALACMMLASETGNMIPLDGTFMQRRAYLHGKQDIDALVRLGFAEVIDDKEDYQTASIAVQVASKVPPNRVSELEKERETELEKEGELEVQAKQKPPPEGLHPLQYAAGLCDLIGLPCKGNLEVIGDAVTAVGKLQKISLKDAFVFLGVKVEEARDRGERVDRWWFQDAKWRKAAQNVGKRESEFERVTQSITDGEARLDRAAKAGK